MHLIHHECILSRGENHSKKNICPFVLFFHHIESGLGWKQHSWFRVFYFPYRHLLAALQHARLPSFLKAFCSDLQIPASCGIRSVANDSLKGNYKKQNKTLASLQPATLHVLSCLSLINSPWLQSAWAIISEAQNLLLEPNSDVLSECAFLYHDCFHYI